VKVLFAGLGGIGQRHLRNLKAVVGDDLEVHAYRVRGLPQALTEQLVIETGVDLESRYGVRVHHDLDSALAQRPTAVFVCNPSSLHIPTAMAAAEAGCHLFVEKPLSHNLADVEELIKGVESRGLVALVGYQLRFHPCLKAVHEQVSRGLIGQPLSAHAEVGEFLPGWHRYEDYRQMYASRADLGGGVILSQIHEMDYLYWLFGLPRRIFTLGGHLSSLEIDVEDIACSVLDFQVNGRKLPVLLHQDYLQRPPSRGCTIVGEEGKIVMNLSELKVDRYDSQGRLAQRESFEGFARNELFLAELRHFLDCIGGRAAPLISLRDGAQSLRMALAAKESLETGQVVHLDVGLA
jgi:predicted dehydrogenase